GVRILGLLGHILHVDNRTTRDGARGDTSLSGRNGEQAPDRRELVGPQVMVGREMNQLSVETEYRAPDRCAEARRVGRDGLEHRLRVRRRAWDDGQNIPGGVLA